MNSIAHITHNRVIGAPPGDESRCGSLSVRDDVYAGYRCMVSHWRPSPEEIAALQRGCVVALVVCCNVHPPVTLRVEEAA